MATLASWSFPYATRPMVFIESGFSFLGIKVADFSNSSNDIEQINLAGQWPIAPGWSSVGRYQYDLNDHGPIESLVGLSYDAGCWTSSVLFHSFALPNDDKMNNTIFFMLELGNLGAIESGGDGALEEALYRNVPGSYMASDLPDNYRQNYLK